MPGININLDTIITKLGNGWDLLEQKLVDPGGATIEEDEVLRGQIRLIMQLINNRITELEMIKAHKGAASVIVRPPSPQEIATLQQALQDVHKVIQVTQTTNQILLTATTIVNAASTLSGATSSA